MKRKCHHESGASEVRVLPGSCAGFGGMGRQVTGPRLRASREPEPTIWPARHAMPGIAVSGIALGPYFASRARAWPLVRPRDSSSSTLACAAVAMEVESAVPEGMVSPRLSNRVIYTAAFAGHGSHYCGFGVAVAKA
jgi:hypothetical protein